MIELIKPVECELYSIFTEDGKRWIHIFAYIWKYCDGEDEWRISEGTGMLVELKDFKGGQEYVDELWEQTKQYEDAMSGERMVETINKYFNGRPADALLSYGNITTNAPDGNYITNFNYGKD